MKATPPHLGRLRFLRLFVLALGLLLAGRVIQIQLFQHDKYAPVAHHQWGREIPINAERGNLYDRDGRALALSVTTWRLGVAPNQIDDTVKADAMYTALGEILDRDPARLRALVDQAQGKHIVLKRDLILTLDEMNRLAAYKPVTLENLRARIYPFDGTGGSLVGFYRHSNDEVVATGLEYSLGSYLNGREGLAQEIATPNPARNLGHIVLEQAAHGKSLVLTVDARLQEICERRLAEAVDQYGAESGAVLILGPDTGDVLAAASWPLMETRAGRHPDLAVWNNRNFTQIYEPGSVFKIFSLASMLRHGAIDTATVFDCSDGDFGSYTIRNSDGHSYGDLPLMQAFSKSSNIYFARAVGNLSAEELYRDLIDFGFGQVTALPYPGQPRGILNPPVSWSGRSKPTISIGQEVAVTQLQLGMALCAVANGGMLLAPRIVLEVRDSEGRLQEKTKPVALRRVLAEPMTGLLREAMARVVKEGTGVGANTDWIAIGGKTGTAQKSRDGRGFTPGAYVASFAGIVPVDDPRLVILTLVDEPSGAHHYAAQSAVPLFREIVTDIKNSTSWLVDAPGARTGILAASDRADAVVVPDVLYLSVPSAAQRLGAAGLVLAGAEKDGVVVQQIPAAGSRIDPGSLVTLTVSGRSADAADPSRPAVCPDFGGLSNRQARSLAARLGIPVSLSGAGYVVGQEPPAGEALTGERIRLAMGARKSGSAWR